MPNTAILTSAHAAWPLSSFLCRVFLIAFGVSGGLWGLSTLPMFWREAPLDTAAAHVIDGETFKPEILQALTQNPGPAFGTWVRPQALRSRAVLMLRLAEESSRTPDAPLPDFGALSLAIERSLSQAPADAYLWLALFWSRTLARGRDPQDYELLRMSYRVGPHEGWVALRRNQIALVNFPQLPPDLAAAAVDEFRDLVASGFDRNAAQLLAGPGAAISDRLLRSLANLPVAARDRFAKEIDDLGLGFTVPGIEKAAPLPWQ